MTFIIILVTRDKLFVVDSFKNVGSEPVLRREWVPGMVTIFLKMMGKDSENKGNSEMWDLGSVDVVFF
jgi:hypothetical protein